MRKDLGNKVTSNCCFASEGSALILNNRQKDFDGHKKYPLTVLIQEMDMLPPDINPLKREVGSTKHRMRISPFFKTLFSNRRFT